MSTETDFDRVAIGLAFWHKLLTGAGGLRGDPQRRVWLSRARAEDGALLGELDVNRRDFVLDKGRWLDYNYSVENDFGLLCLEWMPWPA